MRNTLLLLVSPLKIEESDVIVAVHSTSNSCEPKNNFTLTRFLYYLGSVLTLHESLNKTILTCVNGLVSHFCI